MVYGRYCRVEGQGNKITTRILEKPQKMSQSASRLVAVGSHHSSRQQLRHCDHRRHRCHKRASLGALVAPYISMGHLPVQTVVPATPETIPFVRSRRNHHQRPQQEAAHSAANNDTVVAPLSTPIHADSPLPPTAVNNNQHRGASIMSLPIEPYDPSVQDAASGSGVLTSDVVVFDGIVRSRSGQIIRTYIPGPVTVSNNVVYDMVGQPILDMNHQRTQRNSSLLSHAQQHQQQPSSSSSHITGPNNHREPVIVVPELTSKNELPEQQGPCDTTCSICYNKQVECVIVDCGHVFCSSCVCKVATMTTDNARSCPKCRTRISRAIRIFF